jgi:hypothetical protein
MSVLLWLLIPLAGLLIAAAWVAWRSRPKRTPDAVEGMAEMYRIRQAMNQPMPDRLRQRPEVKVDALTEALTQSQSTQAAPEVRTETQPAQKPSDASFRKSA